MATFDLASLVRGISGTIEGGLRGRQEAEQRKSEQESQGVVDFLRSTQASRLQQLGRERREAREREEAAAQQQKEQGEAFIANLMEQLPEEQRFDASGINPKNAEKEINRRLGITNENRINARELGESQAAATLTSQRRATAATLADTRRGKDPTEERNDRVRKAATAIMEDEGGTFEEALFRAAQREESFEQFTALGLTTDQITAVDEAAQDIIAGKLSFGELQAQVPPNVLQAVKARFKQLQAEQQ